MVSIVTPGGRGSVPSAGLLVSGRSIEAEDAALEDRANRAAVRVAAMRAKKARNASNLKGEDLRITERAPCNLDL
jgi:hypothetical protein